MWLEDLEGLLEVAEKYEGMGQLKDATTAYDQALVLNPGDERARKGLKRTGKIEYVRRDVKHKRGIIAVDWSLDSMYLLSASGDGVVNIWAINSGKIVRHYKTVDELGHVAWSPDRKYVAMGATEDNILVLDTYTGREVARMKYDGLIKDMVWSPDNKYLAAGGLADAVYVWDVERSERIIELPCELLDYESEPSLPMIVSYLVYSVAWSPKGEYIVSGSEDGFLRLWDTGTWKVIRMVEDKDGCIDLLAWSPDGRYIAGVWTGGLVKIWTGKRLLLRQVFRCGDRVHDISWHPDSRLLACSLSNGVIEVWDVRTGEKVMVLGPEKDHILSLSWSPDGASLAGGDSGGMVHVWDLEGGGKVVFRIEGGHESYVRESLLSSRGDRIVTVSGDKTLRVWDGKDGRELMVINHSVTALSLSPDNKLLVSMVGDGVARVWDMDEWDIVAVLGDKEYSGWPSWSPDGRYLALGSLSGAIDIWDVRKLEIVKTLKGHEDMIRKVVWSPSGQYLVSISYDKTVRIWCIEGWKELFKVKIGEDPRDVCWSGDERFVAIVCSKDDIVRIWDWKSDSIIGIEESRGVYSVACSPCGKYIAFAYFGDILKVWSVEKREIVSVIKVPGVINNIFWQESDKIFVATMHGDFLYVYPLL